MLNTDKQLAAFRLLNKSGFTSPPSVSLATSITGDSAAKSEALKAAIIPTLTYPAVIAAPTETIRSTITALDAANLAGHDFSAYLGKFQSPSELLNVSVGWSCFLKGEYLPDTEPPALVSALSDTAIVAALYEALGELSVSEIIAAMSEINAEIESTSVPPVANNETASTEASLSDDLTSRLVLACQAIEPLLKTLTERISSIEQLTAEAKQSVVVAQRAFSNAVGISLLDSLKGNAVMEPAVAAITPSDVTEALGKDSNVDFD